MNDINGSENAEAQADGAAIEGADAQADAGALASWVNPLEAELEASALRIGELEGELQHAREALDASNAVFATLKSERDELAEKLAKIEAAPRMRSGAKPAKARAVGPLEKQPAPQDLLELIGAADSVELVFSDGKKELPIEPRFVDGTAWGMTAVGLALRVPDFIVIGPASGMVKLAGYGLFLEGKQIAWAARGDVLDVPPGRRMDMRNDVVFSG